jgi:Zn-dependent metalloprotease
VPLSTTEENGKFLLRDPNFNNAETRDAKNGSGGAGSGNVVLTDDNNKWGEPSDNARAKAGIDAQYGAVQFLRYLKEFFSRDSLDGKGLRLLSNVHVRSNYVNAYWDGSTMNYGDGDGRTAGPLVDKDVASHEPMHGLTQHTSNLVYRGDVPRRVWRAERGGL